MCLNEKANVSDEVRRIINNGFFTYHPFKYNSGQLEDYLKIMPYVQELPGKEYNHCLDAIEKTVKKVEFCPSCYMKGLAYLKILTQKSDPDNFEKYEQMYWDKYRSLDTDRDFESEVIQLMQKNNE